MQKKLLAKMPTRLCEKLAREIATSWLVTQPFTFPIPLQHINFYLFKTQPINITGVHIKTCARIWKFDIQSWNSTTEKPCTPYFIHSSAREKAPNGKHGWCPEALVNERKWLLPLREFSYHHIPFVIARVPALPCFCRCNYCKALQWQRQHYVIQITVEASHINWGYLLVLHLLEISMNYMK